MKTRSSLRERDRRNATIGAMNTLILLIVTVVWMVVSCEIIPRLRHGHGVDISDIFAFIAWSSIFLFPVYISIALANQGGIWTTSSAVVIVTGYVAAAHVHRMEGTVGLHIIVLFLVTLPYVPLVVTKVLEAHFNAYQTSMSAVTGP